VWVKRRHGLPQLDTHVLIRLCRLDLCHTDRFAGGESIGLA